ASMSARNTSANRMACAMGWTWLHLLQFCVSNQSANPEEDALNKPWRPIPSRRISVSATHVLRWVLLPICFALSILFISKTASVLRALSGTERR
ncbi:hypothetical protein BV25DRAFT_1798511, partial [Artomyces pyxidatus]